MDGVPGAEERHRQHRGCPLPELRCELPAAPAHGGGGADSRSVTGPAGARSGQRDRDAERRPPGGERPGSPGGFVGERAVVIGRRYRHGVSQDRWVHGGRDHSGPKVAGRRRRHRTGGQRQVEEHHRIARDRLVGIVPRRCRARRSVSAPVGLSLAPEGDRGDRNGPGTPAALVGRSWHASRRSGSSGRAEMAGRRPAVPRCLVAVRLGVPPRSRYPGLGLGLGLGLSVRSRPDRSGLLTAAVIVAAGPMPAGGSRYRLAAPGAGGRSRWPGLRAGPGRRAPWPRRRRPGVPCARPRPGSRTSRRA